MKLPVVLSLWTFILLSTAALADTNNASPAVFASGVILPFPKVDGEGYLPRAEKRFYIAGALAIPGAPFAVMSSSGNAVFSGRLSAAYFDDAASSGEQVLYGDFSAVTRPGTYTVKIGNQSSPNFPIGPDVYASLYRDALRTFRLIRCGTAVDDPVTGLHHPACHMDDIHIRGESDTGDFTGGWHNAGDYGKWTHMAAITVEYMMLLADLQAPSPPVSPDLTPMDPRFAGSRADLTDEIRRGLTWLFKMQRPDGSVFHKVDTEPNFCYGTPPDKDPYTRYASDPSTIDAADFTAVMAQASRFFASSHPEFAHRCGLAADKSWRWVQANPNIGQTDPYYTDSDPTQEIVWAEAEMARRAGGKPLYADLAKKMSGRKPAQIFWPNPELFGWFSLAEDKQAPTSLRSWAAGGISALADSIEAIPPKTGYGVALQPADYGWGSNENVLSRSAALLLAFDIDGKFSRRECAIEQLHYLLGRNPLGINYITGHGANPIRHPWHWAYGDYGIAIPGWATGGPNGQNNVNPGIFPPGTPPAKCFEDTNVSGCWTFNEGQTTENAALVFVTGLLSRPPNR